MKVLLVNMPWHSLDNPSLAIGILHAVTSRCHTPHEIHELHANLRWAEFLLNNGEPNLKSYTDISNDGFFLGIGDWVFSSALNKSVPHKAEEYSQYLRNNGVDPEPAIRLHLLAPTFINKIALEIVEERYDLICFTSTFQQNIACLSLAQKLKELQPNVLIALGGGNCDGVQGSALHRNFPFIDFVARGEGELTYVGLLDCLSGYGDLTAVEGLCWRQSDGSSVINKERVNTFPVNEIPAPDYDAYFAQLAGSPVIEYAEPKIVVEAARGCWWGEKHHCTFCGLNGSIMKFRSKDPDNVFGEIAYLINKYKTLDVIMVDNIIDMKYFKTLVPRLKEADWDIRMHYEVKSNLTEEQIKSLREARIVHVQPGIESLNNTVLQLMRKGVSGIQNVRTLRDAEENNLTVSWNYLYGFPGEEDRHYLDILDQIPALTHLQPPGSSSRIALERFSPNFNDPSFGFTQRSPAGYYFLVYSLPAEELNDIAYVFNTVEAGIGSPTAEQLQSGIEDWREAYRQSTLTFSRVGQSIHINDRRANRPPRKVVLDDPAQVEAFMLLRKGMSKAALSRAISERGLSFGNLDEWLNKMKLEGILFADEDSWISLPTRDRRRSLRMAA